MRLWQTVKTHNAEFHQSLHFLVRQKRSLEKEKQRTSNSLNEELPIEWPDKSFKENDSFIDGLDKYCYGLKTLFMVNYRILKKTFLGCFPLSFGIQL